MSETHEPQDGAPDPQPPKDDDVEVDDDLFGINLGPSHRRKQAVPEPDSSDDEDPAPSKKSHRTLTQLLAAAADDRDTARRDQERSSPDDTS